MFEHVIAEVMNSNNKNTGREDDGLQASMKPVQIKPALFDRALLTLGDTMIRVGLKLKERPSASLTTEPAQTPNFLIML